MRLFPYKELLGEEDVMVGVELVEGFIKALNFFTKMRYSSSIKPVLWNQRIIMFNILIEPY